MNLEFLRNRQAEIMDIKHRYSVLIPLIKLDAREAIVYEVRSKKMRRQPGEISFPGGRIEEGESPRQAAVRETAEELSIEESQIEVLGEGDIFITQYGALVHSFIGYLKDFEPDKASVNKDEVDHIFTVPLEHLMEVDPVVYSMEMDFKDRGDFPYELIPNGRNYNWDIRKEDIYFYEYAGYIIWGMTGRITRNFINIIKLGEKE